jgi:hypothetical protein
MKNPVSLFDHSTRAQKADQLYKVSLSQTCRPVETEIAFLKFVARHLKFPSIYLTLDQNLLTCFNLYSILPTYAKTNRSF